MSSSAIKFEAQLPNADVGTDTYNAVQTFLSNMSTLGPIFQQESSVTTQGIRTQCITTYGLILASQSSTALGYLNTLNSSLGSNVSCISYNVTQQP